MPVTDSTGLSGTYEIELRWTPDTAVSTDTPTGPTLSQALQDQLGLRLESKKVPLDIPVIDHIDRAPTGN